MVSVGGHSYRLTTINNRVESSEELKQKNKGKRVCCQSYNDVMRAIASEKVKSRKKHDHKKRVPSLNKLVNRSIRNVLPKPKPRIDE